MKTGFQVLTIVFSLFLCAGLARAEALEWKIDKAHSNIYFDVRHTFVTVRGLFEDFSGTMVFDPEDKDASRVAFEVNVDSIDTNIEKRDAHLRSADFFEVSQFPHMRFESTRIEDAPGEDQYTLKGRLTIKGVTRSVAVPFTYLGMRDNPLEKGQQVAGFEGEFTINRLDYKVGSGKFAKMGVVGETVHILVALEVLRGK